MSWIDAARSGAGREEMRPLFPWAEAMANCAHDPVHHAEGSPWEHTCLVVESLEADPAFQAMRPERREVLRVAAWAHDIGKPATTRLEEEGGLVRVRQPGHAALGARMIWQHLIDAGEPVRFARDVHALVAWHMRPSHMVDEGPEKLLSRAIRFSVEAGEGGWPELLSLCEADQNGRVSLSGSDKMLPLHLLRIALEEIREGQGRDLLSGPWPFPSQEARLRAIRSGTMGAAWDDPPPANGPKITILSGLPGSGKDTWIGANLPRVPVISLDGIREDMGVGPTDNQGTVLQTAFETARTYLRSGRDFVWNATCLSRQAREKIIRLSRDYAADITAVSMDLPLSLALERNRSRPDPVPDRVVQRLAERREPVGPDEVHRLITVEPSGDCSPLWGPHDDRKFITFFNSLSFY